MNGNATLISNDGVVLSMRKGLFFSVPDSGIDKPQVPLTGSQTLTFFHLSASFLTYTK